MIKVSPYTYLSFFEVKVQMMLAGWEVSKYLFGIIVIYKKPLF